MITPARRGFTSVHGGSLIYKAHIIGHSMAKTVTQRQSISRHGGQTGRVVDISPKAYPGNHHEIFDALLSRI
ncbi:MAG: hypothetical protein R2825_00695 [Saprospiraceae bacterium]